MITTVPESLSRAKRLVAPAMRDAVGRLSPNVRRVVSYHLGWTDADGAAVDAGGGKALRPALAVLGAEAVNADPCDSIPGAVAVELVHNFSLLHDDVMDNDRERRHRPTAWAVFGIGQAIVAGDALLTLAHQLLADRPAAAAALADATATMIAGQAEDLAFESTWDVTFADCLRMSSFKTAALLSCAASIGAIVAGASDEDVRALREYGWRLGVAFQAVDDILGIWGDTQATGKPVFGDLRQHKKTLPVVAALEAAGEARPHLVDLLSREGTIHLHDAARLIEDVGARDHTTRLARDELDAGLRALDRDGFSADARAELRALAMFVGAREH